MTISVKLPYVVLKAFLELQLHWLKETANEFCQFILLIIFS